MNNKRKILTMHVCIFALALTFVSCDDSTTDNDSGNAPPTNGSLTITGLEAYNGNYVTAFGGYNIMLIAAENVNWLKQTVIGSKISNGSVTLKVWQLLETARLKDYSGNDKDTYFSLTISNKATEFHVDAFAQGEFKVDFTEGVGSGICEYIRRVVRLDLGNGIRAAIGFYVHNGGYKELIFGFDDHVVYAEGNEQDYKQDFEFIVDGKTIDYSINIGGTDIRFNPYEVLITAGEDCKIQVKYTANSARPIMVWLYDYDVDYPYYPPPSNATILKSFNTGEKTITVEEW